MQCKECSIFESSLRNSVKGGARWAECNWKARV